MGQPGPKGSQGGPGLLGPRRPKGSQGDPGMLGPRGPSGPKGSQGDPGQCGCNPSEIEQLNYRIGELKGKLGI